MVLATNGVWLIRGSGQGETFQANDFIVRKLSPQGTQSPQSFVEVNGFPMWWGEHAIYNLDYNPQFDSFSVENISEASIQRFFDEIPPRTRTRVKGAFDMKNDIVYWGYQEGIETDAEEEAANPYRITNILCYNIRSKAFYPWRLSLEGPEVRGLMFVRDSIGFDDGKIKLPVVYETATDVKTLSWGDFFHANSAYLDWDKYYKDIVGGEDPEGEDYLSYFITGYRLDGEAHRYVQSNYVILYLETEEDAAAYLQGIFDFANSSQSGQWSVRQEASKQQVYNSDTTLRDINMRRLKIRGKGRALQFRVTSQKSKPFTIIGWSSFQTANADV
jgi:hypothetical protein